jgi:hypothetical protein
MTRARAFVIHLVISLFVIGSVAAALFLLWYPPSLLGFARADRLFALIASIDIVAGPLLTLLVYRQGKKHLKLDLTIIALIQIAFLLAAVWIAFLTRPVYLVGALDRFELVFAPQILPEELEAAGDTPDAKLPWGRPVLVGIRLPSNQDEMMEALELGLQGRDLPLRPRYYVPFEEVAQKLRDSAKPAAQLDDFGSLVATSLAAEVRASKVIETDQFLPVISMRGDALFKLDPETARPLQAIWLGRSLFDGVGTSVPASAGEETAKD